MALEQAYLQKLPEKDRTQAIILEFTKCKLDPTYFIENYITIPDAVTGKDIPLQLYSYQKKAVKDFNKYNFNISMKSRQMGFTTMTSGYVAWYMVFNANMNVGVLANKLEISRKFLRGVRGMLDNARSNAPWLVADYVFNNNGKDSFALKTGCVIKAESNNEDAFRGFALNLCVIDEVAAIDRNNPDRMTQIWSSAGVTLTRTGGRCIAISTPRGSSGWYFEQYTHAEENGWNVIDAHWSQHPTFSEGAYQYIKDETHADGGYIKFFNTKWPHPFDAQTKEFYKTKAKYNFVLDGRVRSPWYDLESKKLGVNRTKCELDCSFAGSGGEVIDPETIRDLRLVAALPENKRINNVEKGIWKSYKEFRKFDATHEYCLVADVATGDGSDFSACAVFDITKKEIVATYKDQPDPITYAKILATIGKKFGGCIVVAEYQGPGLTVLLELKDRLRYTNVYYHTLKKQDVTKNQKRKIGFWQSDGTRTLGGDKLEEMINTRGIAMWSEEIFAELDTWIWDKDGKRRHAPGKNDDLLMAITIGCFYIYHVKEKRASNNTMMRQHLSRETDGIWNIGSSQSEYPFNDLYD